MNQLPTPDEGFGLIGDIRTFILDGVEWRAFEYVSPVVPHERQLIVLNPRTYHGTSIFPSYWRDLAPVELMALQSIPRK
jgi:hypothetical protein